MTDDRADFAAPEIETLLARFNPSLFRDMVDVLKAAYGGGYVNQLPTFEERKALRSKAYRVLKALGVEK